MGDYDEEGGVFRAKCQITGPWPTLYTEGPSECLVYVASRPTRSSPPNMRIEGELPGSAGAFTLRLNEESMETFVDTLDMLMGKSRRWLKQNPLKEVVDLAESAEMVAEDV